MRTDQIQNFSRKVSVSGNSSFNEDERVTKKCDETSLCKGIKSQNDGGDLCFDICTINIFVKELIKNTSNVSTKMTSSS